MKPEIWTPTVRCKGYRAKPMEMHLELKQQKLCVGFLLTNRQFQEVGHCRRHIFGPILPKFYVEFENGTSSCDNLRPCRN